MMQGEPGALAPQNHPSRHGLRCRSGSHKGLPWPGPTQPVPSLASLASPPSLCIDGSLECLSAIEQTDNEDPASPPLPPRPAKWQKAKERLLGGTFPGGLTPLYLIKNVILEQVACVAGQLGQALPHPPSPWSGCPSLATPSTCLPAGVYGTQESDAIGGPRKASLLTPCPSRSLADPGSVPHDPLPGLEQPVSPGECSQLCSQPPPPPPGAHGLSEAHAPQPEALCQGDPLPHP